MAMLRGHYDEAEAMLDALHADVEDPGVLGATPRRASGVLLARRGLPGADRWLAPLLDEALAQARQPPDDVLPRLAGDAQAVVEWCFLEDRAEECRPLAEALLARAAVRTLDLDSAELVRWLVRAGLLDVRRLPPVPGVPEGLAAGLRGDWRAAAAAWERLGAPYEQALELLDSGDVDATLSAITILDKLEAAPAARIARRRLRDLGVTRVPRGPVPSTRANPAGLTERQLDVLDLVAEGLTNGEIAARLVVSTRTVDHHVSAVLAKLGVTTRKEVARRVRELRDG
jgi:DNA-binding CsgD family transcriptional regulator